MNEQPDDYICVQRDPKIFERRDVQLNMIDEPALRIEFQVLASWNDFLGVLRHKGAAQGMMKTWRKKGAKQAIIAAKRAGFEVQTLETWDASETTGRLVKTKAEMVYPTPFRRCHIVLRYWKPTWGTYDVFNPFIKPVIDGFVDCGLMVKDSQDMVPEYAVKFMGVDERLKLSETGKEARKAKAKAGPTPSRYWFDLYHL